MKSTKLVTPHIYSVIPINIVRVTMFSKIIMCDPYYSVFVLNIYVYRPSIFSSSTLALSGVILLYRSFHMLLTALNDLESGLNPLDKKR